MDTKNKETSLHKEGFGATLSRAVRRDDFSIMVATIIIYILFTIFTDAFFTQYNQHNLFRTAGLYIFIALSQVMVQISGGMSLAIGAVGAMSGMVGCMFMQNFGLPVPLGILMAILTGCACGAVIGLIINVTKLPAFVVTLAMQFILNGLVTGITKGYPFADLPEEVTFIGRKGWGFMPFTMVIAIVTLIIVWYMFRYTVLGRRLLATGGNMAAAKLSGIKTGRVALIGSVFSGFFASIAAMLYISRTGSMQTNLGGDWMMMSFCVGTLGTTKPGFISPIGVFFAAILMTMIKNGLVLAQVDVYFENVFLGLIVLFACSLDTIKGFFGRKTTF